ncbi:MarR family protein [Blastococcus aggregatus]|uniref:MarR family protein n=1 Tax=Blastococcus aggregatus TaxID=38502 RepID=A0A285V7V5_9ACTN|nr:helix-turn-helix domain-containing protein [Blastococcus aggregatus]SOC50159.1 MarR family protein [Blastococcus aggregatus]
MTRANPTRLLQDVETEEVIHVLTPKVRRHRQPFTMVFCDALLALLCTEGRRHPDDTGLTLVHVRVLLYLLASAEYENRLERFVIEIADDLKHDRSTVSKALDLLEERELIRRTPNGHGRPFIIDIHPALAFRGKAGQRAAVLHECWADVRMPAALIWTPRP